MLFAQALDELDQKRVWQFISFAEPFADDRVDGCGFKCREFEQLVGEFVGFFAFETRACDADCEAAQVFHQRHAQRDRHGPKFANREWRDRLVGCDETPQRVGVEARVDVGDQRERDRVDSRVVLEFTGGELGKFVVVALWEIVTNFAQLFFDNVVIVDEPLGGGRNPASFAKRFDEGFVSGFEDAAVRAEAGQELGAAFSSYCFMFGSERLRILFEAFDAIKLCVKWFFICIAGWFPQ